MILQQIDLLIPYKNLEQNLHHNKQSQKYFHCQLERIGELKKPMVKQLDYGRRNINKKRLPF
jgi:hypothetical protein